MNDIFIQTFPWGTLEHERGEVTANSAWGRFAVPRDVWLRSERIDRRYPNNFPEGYLAAWCKRQAETVEVAP